MQYAGANFILYGPIERSEVVFPAAAMTDAIIVYNVRIHGIKKRRITSFLKFFSLPDEENLGTTHISLKSKSFMEC
jgi:hypothetical protein